MNEKKTLRFGTIAISREMMKDSDLDVGETIADMVKHMVNRNEEAIRAADSLDFSIVILPEANTRV